MARVMSQRLDRDYPLWEYWLVEGLQQGPVGADLQGAPLRWWTAYPAPTCTG